MPRERRLKPVTEEEFQPEAAKRNQMRPVCEFCHRAWKKEENNEIKPDLQPPTEAIKGKVILLILLRGTTMTW